ncbi:hypothetical protein DFP72DRAFT_84250 [Ephemerocybe angulata]|uniref:Uncharacterized protein n=1 Tax=Ephemerocybe angulata TaxID=980116 RepID=A0A8H6HC99_9AGAR|nr:hypothetical protein DFP72DRAFT_84250 [Tulosesus angulatus]
MSNTIHQPSPRYQTEFPAPEWRTSNGSAPQTFFSPYPPEQYYAQSPEEEGRPPNTSQSFNDSGYGSSLRRTKYEDSYQQPPPQYDTQAQYDMMQQPAQSPQSAESESETLLGEDDEYTGTKPQRYAYASEDPRRRPSLSVPQVLSPELVYLRPGEDYLTQRPPTPPASDTSIRSYIRRFKKVASLVKSLPWNGGERCTADYYPGSSTSRHTGQGGHLAHRPMIVWHAPDYHGGHSAAFFDDSSVDSGSVYLAQPQRQDPSHLDLGGEFDEPGLNQGGWDESVYPVQNPRYSNRVDLTREFSEARPTRQSMRPVYPGGYVPYENAPR